MDFLGHFQNLLLEAVFLVRTEVGVRWQAPSTAAGAPLCPWQWMCPARPSSKAGRHLSCPQTPLRRRAVGAGPRRGPHARPGSWPRGLARRPWTLRGRRCWWSPLGCGALRAGAHVGGRVALRGPAPLGRTARLTLTTPGADTCPRGKDAPAARPQPPLSWPRWRRWAVTTVGPLPGSSPAAASQGPEASEPASRGPVGSAGPGPACRLCLQPRGGRSAWPSPAWPHPGRRAPRRCRPSPTRPEPRPLRPGRPAGVAPAPSAAPCGRAGLPGARQSRERGGSSTRRLGPRGDAGP